MRLLFLGDVVGRSGRDAVVAHLAKLRAEGDYDDEDEPSEGVLYVYELQIRESFRRIGLGKKVMALLEQLCRDIELPKVMLTVFKSNQPALYFYQGLDYKADGICPSQHGVLADYEILSKAV